MSDANAAIRLAPAMAFVYQGRGDVYFHIGKFDLAIADYTKAYAQKDHFAVNIFSRGRLRHAEAVRECHYGFLSCPGGRPGHDRPFGSGRSRMQNVACWRMPSGICCFVWNETRPTLPHARSSRRPVWSFRHSRSVQRSSRRRNSSTMPELHCSAKPCRCNRRNWPLGGAAPTRDRRRGPGKASEGGDVSSLISGQDRRIWMNSSKIRGWNATANKLGSLPKQTRRQTRASTSSIDIRKNISARKKAPTCSGLGIASTAHGKAGCYRM